MQIPLLMLKYVVLRLSMPPPKGLTDGLWTLPQPKQSFVLLWNWGLFQQAGYEIHVWLSHGFICFYKCMYKCALFTGFSVLIFQVNYVTLVCLLLLSESQARSRPACESYQASSSLRKCPSVSPLFYSFTFRAFFNLLIKKTTLVSVVILQSKGPGL